LKNDVGGVFVALAAAAAIFSRSFFEKPTELSWILPSGAIRKTVGTFVMPYWLETG